MKYKIEFFQTTRGDFPVEDFIEEQELALQTKIAHHIRLLTEYGPYLKPPFTKKLANKLYELRISGKVAVRIFYTQLNNTYYLIHAFKKKTQKTPRKEIVIALDRIKHLV
ncbi:hypothetical protein A2690_00145 [Candidatus Roizmanbacteria bacterium RIFCSPHIGHO2_01_FULL_39_12b]|uniref:Addiction module toxin RelE n=1 Tax=Candidatus Roizmanbacteria bacterium RIFCSPHIGHO2_01_FULL_39_12b TaxID=1802030 RepID=A0A1F7GEL4_9BACT|nr:MAG: hypothetical protein A2690_00145 [Candidatus Roizmanbacteria bacterium RIFCSPHIGHO2_01_FULL_39_12b]